MQTLTREQMTEYWSRVRSSGRVRRYPFAQAGVGYSMNDPNAFPQGLGYSERLVFGAPDPVALAQLPNSAGLLSLNARLQTLPTAGGAAAGGLVAPGAAPSVGAMPDTGPYNFNLTPFLAQTVSAQVLASNSNRNALVVQNQSATLTIYFSLGNAAGVNRGIQLGPGLGIVFDIKVPNNFVTVISAGGPAPGIVAEA